MVEFSPLQEGTVIVPFRSRRIHDVNVSHPMERRHPMHNYELVCIVQPDLDETAFNGVLDRVKGWVTEAGGSVDKVDVWGRRRLAYEIRKQREGQYVLLNMSLNPAAAAELERNIRFQESVLRHMLTLVG